MIIYPVYAFYDQWPCMLFGCHGKILKEEICKQQLVPAGKDGPVAHQQKKEDPVGHQQGKKTISTLSCLAL